MNEPISDVRLTMVRQIVSGPFSISAGDVRAILARLDDAERKADLHDQVMHDYRDAMIRANAAERERDALRQDAERWQSLATRLADVPAVQQILGTRHTAGCWCVMCEIKSTRNAAIKEQTK